MTPPQILRAGQGLRSQKANDSLDLHGFIQQSRGEHYLPNGETALYLKLDLKQPAIGWRILVRLENSAKVGRITLIDRPVGRKEVFDR